LLKKKLSLGQHGGGEFHTYDLNSMRSPICTAIVNGNLLSRAGNSSYSSEMKQAGKYPLMGKHTKLSAKQFYRAELLIPGSAVKNITRQIFAYFVDIILLNGFFALILESIHRVKNTGFHKK